MQRDVNGTYKDILSCCLCQNQPIKKYFAEDMTNQLFLDQILQQKINKLIEGHVYT